MSKFCSNCGSNLNDHDNFCPTCGKKIPSSKTFSTNLPSAKSLWKKIFTTKGRLNRWPYSKYSIGLLLFLVIIVALPLGIMMNETYKRYENIILLCGFLFIVACIFAFVAQSMLTIRRLHDLNLSGRWYLLWVLIIVLENLLVDISPVSSRLCSLISLIVSLFVVFKRGTIGDNKYGADPLEEH